MPKTGCNDEAGSAKYSLGQKEVKADVFPVNAVLRETFREHKLTGEAQGCQ